MPAVSIYSDFGTPKNKVSHCFNCFPINLSWSDGTGCHDLSFWMLSFKPTYSLSSVTFIKRFFSSSLLSAISVVSPAYLRLLIFLPAILIPACASSSPHFAWCTLLLGASLIAQLVKNLPAIQETWVRSLSWEDPLEEGMATHCSILAWNLHEQRSLVGYSPWGHRELDTTEQLSTHLHADIKCWAAPPMNPLLFIRLYISFH